MVKRCTLVAEAVDAVGVQRTQLAAVADLVGSVKTNAVSGVGAVGRRSHAGRTGVAAVVGAPVICGARDTGVRCHAVARVVAEETDGVVPGPAHAGLVADKSGARALLRRMLSAEA